MSKYKLTKQNIDDMAKEIMDYLLKNELSTDVNIYFNGKRMKDDYKHEEDKIIHNVITEDGFNPHKYFECAWNHILSMSFEGSLYHVLNYSGGALLDGFNNILNKYGVYYEQYNAWNLSLYPNSLNDEEIEFTDYNSEKPKETIHIWYSMNNSPTELRTIMDTWYELSSATGDQGGCTLGDGFRFEWNDNPYYMSPCSPYQGSCSYEAHIDTIKEMLTEIGATNIYYDYGHLD